MAVVHSLAAGQTSGIVCSVVIVAVGSVGWGHRLVPVLAVSYCCCCCCRPVIVAVAAVLAAYVDSVSLVAVVADSVRWVGLVVETEPVAAAGLPVVAAVAGRLD